MPNEAIAVLATLLSVVEISFGLLLLFNVKTKLVLIGTLLLFIVFVIFSIYGTIVGIKTDCGCFGSLIESNYGWGMIGRNTTFVALNAIYIRYFMGTKKPPAGV